MLAETNFTDPWIQTLDLLAELSGDKASRIKEAALADARNAREGCRLLLRTQRFGAQVRVIDHPTPSTATIEWRDSTHCCYGDQVWHASRARVAGVCAMSGRAIRPGDAIYKPRPCRPAPLNLGAMILGVVLDDAFTPDR
ncbi:DUF3331 domain-containing protein [Paraburkholderia sp. USG1]|uniref:DUF3331 domain-containing protein n=1 Tax=Paraburkholderia sp. USG1 TaxID=2952268 RepID=UPI002863AECF|nr:DUF3331 domain-containing protein [Paraburkholderia sp. USG1]MDR8395679.1 DUF3331 domain-containing protein [Paraburkholderia sp. USG1]